MPTPTAPPAVQPLPDTADFDNRQTARLRLKLTESAVDFYSQLGLIDYRDLQADFDGFGAYPAAIPPYFRQSQKRGEVLPVYVTEIQLRTYRDRSRRLFAENEFAICASENRRSYVAGKGLTIKAGAARPDCPPQLIAKTQMVIDLFSEANGLDELASDIVLRWDRDGEAFVRQFPQNNGLILFRPVEAEHIQSPQGDTYGPAYSFGVQTDENDIQSVIGYWVQEQPWKNPLRTFVAASDIQHTKLNTDLSAKRGLPTFYPVEQNLRRAEGLLAAMSSMAQTRAKIALIRKFNGVLQDTAQALATSLTEVNITDPSTGTQLNLERLRYGTILNSSKNIEYEFPGGEIAAGDYVAVLQAELRAVAARLCMPEWMLTVDASNANYSSSLIAEAPSTKMFERLQRKLCLAIGESRRPGHESLIWRQIKWAVHCGVLPAQVFQFVKIQVEGPSLVVRDKAAEANTDKTYFNMRVKSRKTIQQQAGLDTKQEDTNFREDGIDPTKPVEEKPPQMPGQPRQPGDAPSPNGKPPMHESKDASGHEHAADGKFGTGGGSGATHQGDSGGREPDEKQVKKLVKSIVGTQEMTQKRAKSGGEIGPNGEPYPGGAFIATTDLPKKIKAKIEKSATGKVQVDGYKWEVPKPGEMSILNKLGGTVMNPRDGSVNHTYLEYRKSTPEEVKMYEELAEKWKKGERWVSVNDYPGIAGIDDAARLAVAGQPIPGDVLDKMPKDWQAHFGKYKAKEK